MPHGLAFFDFMRKIWRSLRKYRRSCLLALHLPAPLAYYYNLFVCSRSLFGCMVGGVFIGSQDSPCSSRL